METLASVPVLGPIVGVALPFLLVLGLVVFVHEYGHYIVGRWCGIHADVFSIGFGPEIVGWEDRRGTRWRVAWVPLGGYVKFAGDADPASGPDDAAIAALSPEERRRTLNGAPLWARALTVLAGPVANFLLTIALLAAIGMSAGRVSDAPVIGAVAPEGQAAAAGFRVDDRVLEVDGAPVASFAAFVDALLSAQDDGPRAVIVERDGARVALEAAIERPARVRGVAAGAPAEAACLKPGDEILAVDGSPIASFGALQRAIEAAEGRPLALTLKRGEATLEKTVTPRLLEQPDRETGRVTRRSMIGVIADFDLGLAPRMERLDPISAIGFGVEGVTRLVGATFAYVGSIASGDADGSSIGGPIGIATASGQAAGLGLVGFIGFVATVSTAIGLINLFPIPVLDGGHLVFYGVEAVRGRPLGRRAAEVAMTIGLGAILLLLVFATTNDVARLTGGLVAQCE